MDVFDLYAKIGIDSSSFNSGLKEAEGKLSGFGSAIKSGLGTIAKVAGTALTAATGAVSAFGVSAYQTGMAFDGEMSRVQAISGATAEDFTLLRDKAMELGAQTKFSASEAAKAMEYMAMAGWKTEDMLGGVSGIMDLAAASGEDLATTSDIVTDALTAFKMTAEDSAHFADILAAASSNANTNVGMMGETFKYAAPLAGTLGFNAEDTALAIGLMANSGIKASMAGTSLRSVFNNLAAPSEKAENAIRQLGLETKNSDGTMRNLRDIMGDMRKIFTVGSGDMDAYNAKVEELNAQLEEGTIDEEDYTEAVEAAAAAAMGASSSEQAKYASMIAGKYGMSGLLAIINASEEDWNKLADAIDNCDGAAAQMAGTMQNNLQGSVTIFQSALEGLKIKVSDIITPTINEFVKLGTRGVNALSTIFTTFDATPYLDEMGRMTEEGAKAQAEFQKNREAAFDELFATISDGVGMIVENVPVVIDAGMKLLGAFGQGIADNLPQILSAFAEVGDMILGAIKTAMWDAAQKLDATDFEALGAKIGENLANLFDLQNSNFGSILYAGARIIENLSKGITEAIPSLVPAINSIIVSFGAFIMDEGPALLEAGSQLLLGIAGGIGESLPTLIPVAIDVIMTLIGGIVDHIDELASAAVLILNGISEGLENALPTLIPAAISLLQSLVAAINQNVPIILDAAGNVVSTFVDAIGESIPALKPITDLLSFIGEHLETIAPLVGGAILAFKGFNALQGIFSAVSGGFSGIMNIIQGIPQALTFLTGPAGIIALAVAALAGMFVYLYNTNDEFASHVNEKFEEIKQSLSALWEKLQPTLATIGETFANLMETLEPIFELLLDTVVSKVEMVLNILEPAIETLGNVFAYAMDIFGAIIALLTGDFDGALEHVKSAMGHFGDAWGSLLETAKASFDGFLQQFGIDTEELGANLTQFCEDAKAGWEILKKDASEKWASIKSTVSEVATEFAGNVKTKFSTFKENVTSGWSKLKSDASDKWNSIKDSVVNNARTAWQNGTEKLGSLKEKGIEAIENLARSIGINVEEIPTVISTAVDNAIQYLKDLPGKAWQWGKDLIENFKSGINEFMGDPLGSIKNLAGGIADYISFSEPEKGPLSNFHTYAPDMMKLFAQGIRDNSDIVTDQIEKSFDFADIITDQTVNVGDGGYLSTGAATINNYITIDAHGASSNQDWQQVADIVSERISYNTNRRLVAMGAI